MLLERSKQGSAGSDLLDARKAFEEELALDPTNANAAYELGEMHRKAGDFEAARKLFEQALANDPAFEQALVGLGRTLVALDRPADAIPHLRTAIKVNPESDVAYYQLAQAYRQTGNAAEQEKALASFKRLRNAAAQRSALVPDAKADVTPQVVDLKPPK